MAEDKNVGAMDSIIRIVLGFVCLGLVVYNYAISEIMPLVSVIGTGVLILLFLKTGITKVCPILKALGISTR